MSSLHGFGLGIVSVNAQGETLDTYYPAPIANVNGDEASALREVSGRLDARQLRELSKTCLLYTSPSPRDLSTSRMPSSA